MGFYQIDSGEYIHSSQVEPSNSTVYKYVESLPFKNRKQKRKEKFSKKVKNLMKKFKKERQGEDELV